MTAGLWHRFVVSFDRLLRSLEGAPILRAALLPRSILVSPHIPSFGLGQGLCRLGQNRCSARNPACTPHGFRRQGSARRFPRCEHRPALKQGLSRLAAGKAHASRCHRHLALFFVVAELTSGGAQLSRNLIYLAPTKEVHLEACEPHNREQPVPAAGTLSVRINVTRSRPQCLSFFWLGRGGGFR